MHTGKLRYAVRDFPLESIHAHAFKAAEAAHCAAEHGKYWDMHDRLFANTRNLSPAELPAHAAAIGLDRQAFQACLDSGRHADRVRRDLADGEKAGIRGTPTFFLGVAEGDASQVRAVRMLRGAQPFAAFKAVIDAALASDK